jgi:hypothetical protein
MIKLTAEDYEAIHKSAGIDIQAAAVSLENGCLNISQLSDYIAKRTDVAFRRGYFAGEKRSKITKPKPFVYIEELKQIPIKHNDVVSLEFFIKAAAKIARERGKK